MIAIITLSTILVKFYCTGLVEKDTYYFSPSGRFGAFRLGMCEKGCLSLREEFGKILGIETRMRIFSARLVFSL
jgi:hypothetical protein